MESVVLVIHLILALAIIAVVLIQPSEGGGLGSMGGGGGGFGGLTTARGAANLLTRLTAIFVAGFITTSLVLAILAGNHGKQGSILEASSTTEQATSVTDTDAGVVEAVESAVEEITETIDVEPEIPVSQ